MDAAWSGDDAPVVGIVNSETVTGIGTELVGDVGEESGTRSIRAEDALASTLDAHDATTVRGGLEDVLAADPTLLVTAGAADLSAVARALPDVPVLPVGDVAGVDAVERDRFPAALEAVLEGSASRRERPVLGIEANTDADALEGTVAGERALFDVTLVTDEPARISEFGVESRGESVAKFRADGVVVATPAGSHGYASAVKAPRLSPAVDGVAVALIAPFATRTRNWVLPDDDVTLTVERNECDISVVADDRTVGTVTVGSQVFVGVDGMLSTLVVPDDVLNAD